MDLRQLSALVAVAETGTFSSAAEALHTVQSNVSSHVAHLEKELEVQLVDRHDGSLTEEGIAVVERARRVSSELEALVADIAAMRSEVVGTVRIGMIGTTARWLTPRLLDSLAVSHPRVRPVFAEGTSATLLPGVAGGRYDAALVNMPVTHKELVASPLFNEELVLVTKADEPLASRRAVNMGDLAELPLLLPAPDTAYRDEIDNAARLAGVTLQPRAELDGLRLIASLTWQGYGPAILPASGAAGMAAGYVRIPVADLPPRRVGTIVRRGRPSAPTRAVLDVLRSIVAELPARGSGGSGAGEAGEGGAGAGTAGPAISPAPGLLPAPNRS